MSPSVLLIAQEIDPEAEVLRRDELRYRTVADFTYDWEYWLGNDGTLLYNSPSCQRVTGRTAADFIAKPTLLEEIAHPEDRPRVREHLRFEQRSRQEHAALEFRIMTPDGDERWIGHVCQPVFDAQGKLLGRRASNRDTTAQKKAEQDLLHAERLATIGRMVASLAHEVNNPLQSMTNSLELVLNFPLDEGEKRSILEGMQQEMERLQEVAGGILNLARHKQMNLATTNLQDILQKALNMARDHIRRHNIRTQVTLKGDIPLVQASPDQIEQVFLNLIINAVESMKKDGSLLISLHCTGEFVEVEFADSGRGIPQDQMEYIFDPFFTTKVRGTGLGLSVSRRIVHEHGGEITSRNRPGGGAVFTVSLAIQPGVLSRLMEKSE